MAASVLSRMRQICLALPDTEETPTWGQPHFRVCGKIFAGCGDEHGKTVIGFKLEMDHADAVIQDPRFWRAPYVGHKGWVSLDAARVDDWDEVRALVLESYRLIAPKRTLAKLEASDTAAGAHARPAPGRKRATAKAPAQRRTAPRSTRTTSKKRPGKPRRG